MFPLHVIELLFTAPPPPPPPPPGAGAGVEPGALTFTFTFTFSAGQWSLCCKVRECRRGCGRVTLQNRLGSMFGSSIVNQMHSRRWTSYTCEVCLVLRVWACCTEPHYTLPRVFARVALTVGRLHPPHRQTVRRFGEIRPVLFRRAPKWQISDTDTV